MALTTWRETSRESILVDGMLGTGAEGALRGAIAEWTQRIGDSDRFVCALDMPTGVDATSGAVHDGALPYVGSYGVTPPDGQKYPKHEHPVICTHPETGRRCLFLGDHAESIAGMPYDEGRALIEELNALAVHPDLTYEHRWKPRELLVWDNRCVMHRATAYDAVTQGRVIRRCTVLGEIPA